MWVFFNLPCYHFLLVSKLIRQISGKLFTVFVTWQLILSLRHPEILQFCHLYSNKVAKVEKQNINLQMIFSKANLLSNVLNIVIFIINNDLPQYSIQGSAQALISGQLQAFLHLREEAQQLQSDSGHTVRLHIEDHIIKVLFESLLRVDLQVASGQVYK